MNMNSTSVPTLAVMDKDSTSVPTLLAEGGVLGIGDKPKPGFLRPEGQRVVLKSMEKKVGVRFDIRQRDPNKRCVMSDGTVRTHGVEVRLTNTYAEINEDVRKSQVSTNLLCAILSHFVYACVSSCISQHSS